MNCTLQTSKKAHLANSPIAEYCIAGGFECGNGGESELQTLLSAFLRRHAALPKRTIASVAAAGSGCELDVLQNQAQVEMESQLLYLQEAARVKRLKVSAEFARSGTTPNPALHTAETTVCFLCPPARCSEVPPEMLGCLPEELEEALDWVARHLLVK